MRENINTLCLFCGYQAESICEYAGSYCGEYIALHMATCLAIIEKRKKSKIYAIEVYEKINKIDEERCKLIKKQKE